MEYGNQRMDYEDTDVKKRKNRIFQAFQPFLKNAVPSAKE